MTVVEVAEGDVRALGVVALRASATAAVTLPPSLPGDSYETRRLVVPI